MNPLAKIIGALVLFGGGAYGLSFLKKAGSTAITGKRISVNVSGVNPPAMRNGSVILSVNIAIDNPTNNDLLLKKPNLKAFYNGKEVGNSIPSEERTTIKANDRTTIKGINIQVPFVKLGSLAWQLVAGKQPKMTFEVEMLTEANGIPYTDKQTFDL